MINVGNVWQKSVGELADLWQKFKQRLFWAFDRLVLRRRERRNIRSRLGLAFFDICVELD